MNVALLNTFNAMPVIIVLVILAIAVIVLISSLKIVRQSRALVIERLGGYRCTLTTGVHFVIPFIDKVANNVTLMEQVSDFPPQPVITRDNVRMQIDTVVFFMITDCKLFTYGVTNPLLAIESLTATTLRNIIGELDLDQTLTSRDIINSKMRTILDEATDAWGIKVTRVELKNIIPPREIQDAMEKQMKAERERREQILRAEGEKNSTILVAEGRKQEIILAAQAEKESAILRAEAAKEAKIREAEGEAEAIIKVQEATAQGLRMIKEVELSQAVIALRSLEALERVADGRSTKIIIPSEIQNVAALISSLTEVSATDTPVAE